MQAIGEVVPGADEVLHTDRFAETRGQELAQVRRGHGRVAQGGAHTRDSIGRYTLLRAIRTESLASQAMSGERAHDPAERASAGLLVPESRVLIAPRGIKAAQGAIAQHIE